ncbi:D-alanyl-D-alanine carboxypeptidase [Candidatus Saccharibacteria bacterium]|nr:D-alanyl-D-alanine carboxypeptidase [Candidatus Saccharibacteria bacterium]
MRLVKIPVQAPKKRSKYRGGIATVVIACLLVAVVVQLLRPLPAARIRLTPASSVVEQAKPVELAWPNDPNMQAAIGAEGYGVLATSGSQKPVATASIAKVITALCVLQKYPLKQGEEGPTIRLTEADYALYQTHVAQGGSNVPVYIGQEMSLYQAIQALMIPSANNIADSLAVWAFGSQEEYKEYASNFVANLGMKSTTIGNDASGFDVDTRSTARDLILLGLAASKKPVLMEIASQKSASFPGLMQVANYNQALGKEGIVGLKTGNNIENPGGLLFAQEKVVAGKKMKIIGVVLGARDLPEALGYSVRLAATTPSAFNPFTVHNTVVGTIETEWGGRSRLQTVGKRQMIHFSGSPVVRKDDLRTLYSVTTTMDAGRLLYRSGAKEIGVNLKPSQTIADPSIWWRLTRLR